MKPDTHWTITINFKSVTVMLLIATAVLLSRGLGNYLLEVGNIGWCVHGHIGSHGYSKAFGADVNDSATTNENNTAPMPTMPTASVVTSIVRLETTTPPRCSVYLLPEMIIIDQQLRVLPARIPNNMFFGHD